MTNKRLLFSSAVILSLAFGTTACGAKDTKTSEVDATGSTIAGNPTTPGGDAARDAAGFGPEIGPNGLKAENIGTAKIDMDVLRKSLDGNSWTAKITKQEFASGRDVIINGTFASDDSVAVCDATSNYVYQQGDTDDSAVIVQYMESGGEARVLARRLNKADSCKLIVPDESNK